MRNLSPEEARQELHKKGKLVNARVTGTLDLCADRPTMFDRNVILLDTVIEGDLFLSRAKYNVSLCLSGVTVNGLLSLDKSEIKELLIVNTTVHGLVSLRETIIKEHLDLRGLEAGGFIFKGFFFIAGYSCNRSIDLLHYAAPTIPLVYDFS